MIGTIRLTLDTFVCNHVSDIVVVKGDYASRFINAFITAKGVPISVAPTAAVAINVRRHDGEEQSFGGEANQDGSVCVPLTQWMSDVPGRAKCSISVTSNGKKISTTYFYVQVQDTPCDTSEISEDDPRKDLITEVIENENVRQEAERERNDNEASRNAYETERRSYEDERREQEELRRASEALRINNENSRSATFLGWESDIAQLPSFDARISKNEKRITNLEQGLVPEPFETDDSVAYTKDVPANALPYAEIQKVGGITRKCKNLIPYPYQDTTKTVNNITFTDNGDGSITVNGTATAAAFFILAANYDNTGKTFTDCTYFSNTSQVSIYIPSGTTVSNKKYYPMVNEGSALPYEPYFEGLRSAPVTEVASVGVNLWDEQWEVVNSVRLGSKNFIPVKPNTRYFMTVRPSNGVIFHDANYKYIGEDYNATFTTPADCFYIKFLLSNSYGTVYKNDVCLNEYDTTINGKYYPYNKNTLPIPEAVRALDGYGEGVSQNKYNFVHWDGEEKETKFNINAKRIVLDGITNKLSGVSKTANNLYFGYLILNDALSNASVIVEGYKTSFASEIGNAYIGESKEFVIFHKDQSLTTASAINAELQKNPIEFVYACNTEIIDISDLITLDNFIEVEPYGTLTFENEHHYDVPSTVVYQLKGVSE